MRFQQAPNHRILAPRNIKVFKFLRRETSQISNPPAAFSRNAYLESLGRYHNVFAGRNLSHLIIRNYLVAIKPQAEFGLARRQKNGDGKMVRIELCQFVRDRACGKRFVQRLRAET